MSAEPIAYFSINDKYNFSLFKGENIPEKIYPLIFLLFRKKRNPFSIIVQSPGVYGKFMLVPNDFSSCSMVDTTLTIMTNLERKRWLGFCHFRQGRRYHFQ